MPWWEDLLDSIPLVGTGYRTVRAIAAHVDGDHEKATKQWGEAGMNLAGDALGLVTGGAGKVASTAAKAGAKTVLKVATKNGIKAMTKETLKQAAKAGGKAATRAARKQLTKKAMKKYAKKYVKKKVKKAIKKGASEAAAQLGDDDEEEEEESEEEGGEICILEEVHRFSGHWNGFYKQYGTDNKMRCMLIIDQDGNMAGHGNDISKFSLSGKIEPDGTFRFEQQYEGPEAYDLVVFSGSVEWKDQAVLQGTWTIPADGQEDEFMIVPHLVGLEASVISLCCYSAQEVLGMDRKRKRGEIIDALCEMVSGIDKDDLSHMDDDELCNIAEVLTCDELYED